MSRSRVPPDQAFKRIKHLCYVGLDLGGLQSAVMAELAAALPFSAFCFNLADPNTGLLVGIESGGVGGEEEWRFFLDHLYFQDYHEAFRRLTHARCPAEALSQSTGGRLESALRYRLQIRRLGMGDEIRAALVSGHRLWGSLVLLREDRDPFFTQENLMLVARIAPHIGAGVRAALAGPMVRSEGGAAPQSPGVPGVLILDESCGIEEMTPAGALWLERIRKVHGSGGERGGLPVPVLQAVGLLQRALAMRTEGEEQLVPNLSVCTADGWVTIRTARILSAQGLRARVLVSLEPASPRELSRLRMTAFGLTPQEEAVAQLVARGCSTQQMADALHISAYTVQEHLSHIFDKVGVRTRRDLVKRLFLESELWGR